MRKNPSYGDSKPPRKRAASKLTSDYKEPLRRLRSIGIKLYPEISLDRIRKPSDLTDKQRSTITKTYSYYDYLFSRPHVVADFSLPEGKIQHEYAQWRKETDAALKLEGFTRQERAAAIESAGKYADFKKARVRQNDDRKLAAQEFAGHHILDKNLSGAVIPVVTGMPDKVRLKYDKQGNIYVQEGAVTMHNVKIDPQALARGKGKYLEKLLAGFKDTDRFMLVTGDYMTLANSGYKGNIIKKMLRHMERYSAKMLKAKGRDDKHHWKNWMLSLRVMRGNPYHTEALRSSFEDLRKRMKAEKKAAYDAADALKRGHERKMDTASKRRRRSKDL